ncbi:MAG TPA: hypothetical protein VIG71_10795 [Enteractinococcus sp.]
MSNDGSLADGLSSEEAVVDESLAGDDVVDITNDLTPEDFDFDAFVDGVRPGRRAVRVTMRADLAAEIDQIAIQAEALEDPNGDEAQALYDRFEQIQAQIVASQRMFVVEARSDHRGRQIIRQMEKQGITEPGKKATQAEIQEWNEEVAIRRLADAIVIPSNVTVDGLKKLEERAPSEVNKLYGAMHQVNTNPVKGVDPNFSLRR